MGRHERVAALAGIDREGLVAADLGCGSGRAVRALLELDPAPELVHAVDVAPGLDDDLAADDRVRPRLHDLDDALPFGDASLDRVVSVNLVEHLADPDHLLGEVARVLRPGGTAVLAHSDWDTVLLTGEDDALTRALVDRFVAAHHVERSDGFAGRRLLARAATSPLSLVAVDSWADPHRRFDAESVAWKVAVGIAASAGDDLADDAQGWLEGLGRAAAEDRFLYAVTDVAVVLRRD